MSGKGATPAVEIRGLAVRYGDREAVRGVDLDVPEGALTALVGPSGCGKTSLLRAIAGFETPAGGSIRVGGEEVAGPGTWVAPEKRRVGMVFQEGALFPHLDVRRNVLYGLKGRRDRGQRARAALELVGMATRAESFPDQLSGGEQQRVALARALAPGPRLVLLDEPFASLDAGLRRRLRDEVRAILRAAGATALLVTHDQEEALSVADTVAVMIAGRVLQVADPDEIYHRPVSLEAARFLGEGQLVACEVRRGRARSFLGTVDCVGDDGPGLLLVRPEDLALGPPEAAAPGALAGRIVGREYFGHDRIDRVEVAPGAVLRVRTLSSRPASREAPVKIWLRGNPCRSFPRAELDDELEGEVVGL